MAAAAAYFLNAQAGFALDSLAIPAALFVLSALLPDIDSPSSKPRRYFRAAEIGALAAVSFFFYANLASIHPLAPFALPLVGFFALERAIPGHRGVLHSPFAATAWGGLAFLASASALLGAAAGAGYFAHLAIDFAGDRI